MRNFIDGILKQLPRFPFPSARKSDSDHGKIDRRFEDILSAGNSHLAKNELSEAIDQYKMAINLRPTHHSGYLTIAYAQKEIGDLESAKASLNRVLAIDPDIADAHYLLGNIAAFEGDDKLAAQSLRKAIDLNPMLLPAYGEVTTALFRTGKRTNAFSMITRGLALFPQNAELHFFQGNLLAESGKFREASEAYERAVEISPDFAEALANLGNCERHLGVTQKALAHLRHALKLKPHHPVWHSNLLFTLQYTGELDAESLFQEHLEFARIFETPFLIERKTVGHLPARSKARRLKVGYVSGDLRAHSLAYFIEPVLRHHDRSAVEVFCYYTYTDRDETSLRLEKLSDHWRNCVSLTDDEMADLIRRDEIDVLIDLSGHTGYNRLSVFARKPAPIQMTWLGYQATTGLASMDYRITDAGLDPVGQTEKFHTEKLLRLSTAAVFQPEFTSPEVSPLPCLTTQTVHLACFNNPAKMTDAFVAVAARILNEHPNTKLVIGNMSDVTRTNLTARFAFQGTPAEQLILLDPMSITDYLRKHQDIDFALDTFPYNGGTTTLHSLWMGVPVLSLEGIASVGRVGAETMRGLGFPEFACANEGDYVKQAGYFINNPSALESVRLALRQRMAAVLVEHARGFTAELEQNFYRAAANI